MGSKKLEELEKGEEPTSKKVEELEIVEEPTLELVEEPTSKKVEKLEIVENPTLEKVEKPTLEIVEQPTSEKVEEDVTEEIIKLIAKTKEYALMRDENTIVKSEEKIRQDVNAEKLNVVISETTKDRETV